MTKPSLALLLGTKPRRAEVISAKEGQKHDRSFASRLQAKKQGGIHRQTDPLRTARLRADDAKSDGSAIRDTILIS
jgi:hypothetical protein